MPGLGRPWKALPRLPGLLLGHHPLRMPLPTEGGGRGQPGQGAQHPRPTTCLGLHALSGGPATLSSKKIIILDRTAEGTGFRKCPLVIPQMACHWAQRCGRAKGHEPTKGVSGAPVTCSARLRDRHWPDVTGQRAREPVTGISSVRSDQMIGLPLTSKPSREPGRKDCGKAAASAFPGHDPSLV